MLPATNNKTYDLSLISKIKRKTGPKTLKKIRRYLRDATEVDIKDFIELKVKICEDSEKTKTMEEKKDEFKIVAPIINVQHYFKDFQKRKSKSKINYEEGDENGENTPSTVVDDEEVDQVDSSDISDDE